MNSLLVYIIWGDRLPVVKRAINRATDEFVGKFRRKDQEFSRFTGGMNSTDNSAFDD